MNERIDELIKKAGMIEVPSPTGFDDFILVFNKGKFAELIVHECLNQCYFRGMNDELYAGQLKAAQYIEEHFGVKQ